MKALRLLLLVAMFVLMTGCSTVHLKTPEGLELSYSRLWMESEGFDVAIDNLGSATVARSSPDNALLEQLLPLALKGAAAKGAP